MAKGTWIRASLVVSLGIVPTAMTLLGCNPIGAEARRIETGFVGMEARSVRRCMGEAHFYEIRDDGSEFWAYTAPLNEDVADVEISRVTGRGTAHARPRVEGGSPLERESYETTQGVREGKVPRGSCVYLFNLREGLVDAYRARGRSHQDMNADASCTVALNRCVPVVATTSPSSQD